MKIPLNTLVAGSVLGLFLPLLTIAAPTSEPSISATRTVFEAGKEGYKVYRIPALIRAANGDLLAFCEARQGGDASEIDLVLKRSTDGGVTWSALQVVQESDNFQFLYDEKKKAITIGNPAPVVDLLDPDHPGRIWLPFTLENDRVFVISSDDHGKTWSKRREITQEVKKDNWGWYATGPVHSIQLQRGQYRGRLVIPCDHRIGGDGKDGGPLGAHLVLSDDHGKTWRLGAIDTTYDDGLNANETTVVELNDGSLYINTRDQNGKVKGNRGETWSRDGGETFSSDNPEWKAFRPLTGVIDPPVVQCAMLRAADDLILFSGPDDNGPTGKGRSDLRIRFSTDEAKTWSDGPLLHTGPAAYSDMALISEKSDKIGVLFEAGDAGQKNPVQRIVFVALNRAAIKTADVTYLNLDADSKRQVIVDREPGQYLGHPTTCLLDDGKTILCVYPKGHGKGGIVYKRSKDGGRTWTPRLPTPANWVTSREVPTLHRVTDAAGKKRIIMWSGLYPARLAVTEDDGKNWGELKPVGEWGGIVVMGTVIDLKTGPGHYMAFFHDDDRFISKDAKQKKPIVFTLYTTTSTDGGLTWADPKAIYASSDVHLCEPGALRSPDGKQIAVLLRENARRKNSHIIFSADEGKTWTEPREVPDSLNGDRHTAKYAPDGRLFISFRSNVPKQKEDHFKNGWVAWVGTYDDLVKGTPGQYQVLLKQNYKGRDCAYPGVEILPDGTFVTTTYGHWAKGEEPYVISVRLKLDELDAMVKVKK